ncbi:hypothetical protein FSP39_014468 [Pinctada imbricata]|uniref:Uncharacterized protein n=1 Tax=Pinctada imbricata TaxID=66713 RepID=A0AA88XZD4_PINIB|nr:hypothetical protein FSP39_014468 [Pinctada imbricata]
MYEKGNVTDVKISTDRRTLITDMISGAVIECDKRGKRRVFLEHSEMVEPWASAFLSDGSIVVTSRKARVVYIFGPNGEFQQTFGKNFFQRPCGVAVDKLDRIIVSDCLAGEVSVHDRSGTWLFNLRSTVSPAQQFSNPQYIHVTDKNIIVVSDTGNHSVKLFNDKGEFLKSFGKFGKEDGFLKSPHAVCSDSAGQLIVADHYNDRVSLFSSDGEFRCHLLTSEDGLLHPQGVILSTDGKMFVTHGQMKANEVIVYKFQRKKRTFLEPNFMPLFDE